MNPPPIHLPVNIRNTSRDVPVWTSDPHEWREAFAALFKANPAPMLLLDPDTLQIVDCNLAAEKLYLLDHSTLVAMTYKDLCLNEEEEKMPRAGGFEAIFSRHFRRDGQLVHLRVGTQSLSMEGKVFCLLSIMDVSAQKNAEAAYNEVQRKYQSIIENAVEGFYINIPDGRFVEVNPAFAKMLGYDSPKQLVEQISDIATQLYVNPAQRKVLQDLLTRKGYVRGIEFQAKRRDGKIIWLSVSAREVKDALGKVLYYEGLAEDVTDRKDVESRLREMNRTLAANMAQLERSNADLEQFAYAVSHDLKEPLRLISSYLTLLSLRHQEQLNSEGQEFLSVAADGARRMKALIEDLLSYSTLDSTESLYEDVDLRDLAEEALKILQSAIQDSGAIVTVGQLPVVRGSRTQLTRVFTQLVENALKFRRLDAQCQISLRSTRKDDHWLVEVRDNGVGIDSRLMNKVFQIFQRGHSKGRIVGNGIGLAICRKIIEMHGGRIWLESVLGEGTAFFFTIAIRKS